MQKEQNRIVGFVGQSLKIWNPKSFIASRKMGSERLNDENIHSKDGQKNQLIMESCVWTCVKWKCVRDQWRCWIHQKFW